MTRIAPRKGRSGPGKPLDERIEGASLESLIVVRYVRGAGTHDDPVHRRLLIYRLDGSLVAEARDG